MAFRFENLKVFQSAAELSNRIDLLVEKFPRKELYSLSSQIKRAADSVVLNIAEGALVSLNRSLSVFWELPFDRVLKWSLVFTLHSPGNKLMKVNTENFIQHTKHYQN